MLVTNVPSAGSFSAGIRLSSCQEERRSELSPGAIQPAVQNPRKPSHSSLQLELEHQLTPLFHSSAVPEREGLHAHHCQTDPRRLSQ